MILILFVYSFYLPLFAVFGLICVVKQPFLKFKNKTLGHKPRQHNTPRLFTHIPAEITIHYGRCCRHHRPRFFLSRMRKTGKQSTTAATTKEGRAQPKGNTTSFLHSPSFSIPCESISQYLQQTQLALRKVQSNTIIQLY